MSRTGRAVAIDPHVGFPAIFDFGIVNTHGLDQGFIRMNDFAVIDKGQIVVGALNDSVSHGIGRKVDAIAFVSFGLLLQRKGIHIFSVNDGSIMN